MDSVGPAKSMRNRGDEKRAEIYPENDPEVRQGPARAGHNHAGGLRVEDLLHLRVGGQKAFQDPEHLVQLRWVGAEKTKQMPKKEQTRGEGKEELIRHLGCQSRRGIHGGLINQTAGNSPDEPEVSHLPGEFTLPETNIH